MPKTIDKIIVTNMTALRAKYAAAELKKIRTALQRLITADRTRGLVTEVFAVDDAATMRGVNGSPVTTATSPRQNKAAIDAIYEALAPDYVLILGSIDVIPHQNLKNLLYSPADDDDKIAFGDVPYACEASYSTDPRKFFGPTRVVGRLPDLTGTGDARYLVRLLTVAATYKSADASAYQPYFGVSAEIWKRSTALSIRNTFASATAMKTVPPSSAKWPASSLGRLSHFINCHGGLNDAGFYGQPASGAKVYPPALEADYVDGKLSPATIAAAECCYGAQLYDPSLTGGHPGICSTYLSNGAYGFFGSTTIAYGPEDGNDQADLICQFFLQRILQGASLGRAALEARQRFVHTASMSDPSNVKTIAQFNLYGDPSLTPVKTVAPTKALAKGAGTAARTIAARMQRAERRRDLFSRGVALAKSQPLVRRATKAPVGALHAKLRQAAQRSGMGVGNTLSFDVEQPPATKAMPKALVEHAVVPHRVHVVFGARKTTAATTPRRAKAAAPVPPVKDIVALVVTEVNEDVVAAKKIFSR